MEIKCELVVLAAGKGTRMRSSKPKVLQRAAGWPLLRHVFAAAMGTGVQRVYPVLGYGIEEVQAEIESWPETKSDLPVTIVHQKELKGTGDAIREATECLKENSLGLPVVILSGDGPLVTKEVIDTLLNRHQETNASLTVGSMVLEDPTGYGRLFGPAGFVEKCVEEKDATEEQRMETLVNGGVYVVDPRFLQEFVPKLTPSSVTGEFYLTELIALGHEAGKTVATTILDADLLHGVNDLHQLARAERRLFVRKNRELLSAGVRIHDPSHTYIESAVSVGAGTVIEPNVYLRGETRVGENVEIQSGCRIRDCEIASDATIKANSVMEKARVGRFAAVGPMAHLRPEANLGEETKIGNFVEVKKSNIGKGSKVSHLSYVGDAEVGEDVNIGCGFVACNYDGVKKSTTTIGDRAFVGSSVQAIAPVTIHADAYVSTGSVINRDVPSGDLAIGRTRQVNKPGYAKKFLPKPNKEKS